VLKHINRIAYLKHVLDEAEDWSEYFEEVEEVLTTETAIWTKRASKVNVSVVEVPLKQGQTSHWKQGDYGGGRYIDWDALRRLKILVEDREYELKRRKREGGELWVKWFTAIMAAIGALTGLYLAFVKGTK